MRRSLTCSALGLLIAVHGVATAAGPVPRTTATTQQTSKPSAGTQRENNNGGYTLRTSTKLVVLDVMVKDAQGKPALGLKKENFHVTEAGLPQTILNFDEAQSHEVPGTVTVHSTVELDKDAPDAPVNIIVLDELNTRFEEMANARFFLKKYLAAQPERLAVPTMIVVASLTASEKQHNLKMLSDYTQDRRTLESALQHYVPVYPMSGEIMGMMTSRHDRFGVFFNTLERIAEAGKSHPGHKNVIWVGLGFPVVRTKDMGSSLAELWDAMQESVNQMREARVTVSSINPMGETGYVREMDNTTQRMFYDMVEDTGGKAHYMYNDIDMQIGESARDGADFYTIAYRPTTASTAPGKLRKIDVKIDQPGLTVAANKGYALPSQQTPKDVKAQRTSELLLADTSQMVYDGVPVTVSRLQQEGEAFAVKVDPKAVVWAPAENGEQHAELSLLVSTFDARGHELKRVSKNVHAATPEGKTPGEITLPVQFAHDAKAVRVRIVVRVEETSRIGTADVSLRP